MMFGQNPHVGISNLPIDPLLLSTLATEVEVCHTLGLPDTPLEEVNHVNSLHSDNRFKNPLSEQAKPGGKSMLPEAEETMPTKANQT